MMGDVHGHNDDGSVDIEMASYKSQMGVRAIVAIVSIAGDGGALQRRSRATAALTSTATATTTATIATSTTATANATATNATTGITATTTALALTTLATCAAVTPRSASPAQLSGGSACLPLSLPFYP